MRERSSAYEVLFRSKAGRDVHYKLTSYLENQASMIQAAHRQGQLTMLRHS